MKIAIFTDSFLPGVGGTENAVHNFAKELCKTNKVIVFAPDYQRDSGRVFPYRVVRLKSFMVSYNDAAAFGSEKKKVKTELSGFYPDVIHCQTLGPVGTMGADYAVKNNLPLVYTVHTKYLDCYKHDLKVGILAKLLLKKMIKPVFGADRVCTVSENMAGVLKEYGVNKPVTVIKNGGIKRNVPENDYPKGKPVFIYVGLVALFKNLTFSLDVLKKLKERGQSFIFNVIGDGADRKKIQKYAAKKGLSTNVNFLGRITDKSVLDGYYAAADLLLFPSVFDSDGLVILEAANAGTPSMVIENTGAAERIEDGVTGFTGKNDADAFAAKLFRLIHDRQTLKKVGKNAGSLFKPWSDSVDKYLAIYKEEIEKKSKKR